ncbi:MAG: prephenate dehydratase [Leptospiraceae bacterium]|nr:prephenate dehydratase [Leptospiraceae bacterium]MDW7976461.1 prephenate dehydratase [Leptospiraceae bacterium]
MQEQEIDKYRKEIDKIDKEIVHLILKRAEIASLIGKLKKQSQQSIYKPTRELKIYENIKNIYYDYYKAKVDKEPFPLEALLAIYRELMSGTIKMEEEFSVGYLGPPGSFSHLAVQKRFGSSISVVPYQTIREIFREVELGERIRYGVVPVENTIGGSVSNTLDEIVNSTVTIYAEIYVKVSQNLLAPYDIPLNKIRKIYTIGIAKEQCMNWLSQNLDLKKVEIVETQSTAAATELAATRKDGVAIGSELAAEIYQLKIIARNIHDFPNNITRFWVLSNKEENEITNHDKTSIIVGVHDKPGSLYSILEPFYKSNVNLTKIESRRTKRIYGEYNFFIDFDGHKNEKKIQKILKIIEKKSSFLKVLGSYPKANLNY